jgi:hypothetical protein
MSNPEVNLWLVKDTDGEYVTVRADNWEVSGNGLVFKLGDVRVAHFIRWVSYRRVPSDSR